MGPYHRSLRARSKPRAPGTRDVSPTRKQVPLHSVGLHCRRPPSPAQRAQAHPALGVDMASDHYLIFQTGSQMISLGVTWAVFLGHHHPALLNGASRLRGLSWEKAWDPQASAADR